MAKMTAKDALAFMRDLSENESDGGEYDEFCIDSADSDSEMDSDSGEYLPEESTQPEPALRAPSKRPRSLTVTVPTERPRGKGNFLYRK